MNKHKLSVYYQNCRGLRTKLHTLYMNILSHSFDIIILTETWLHEDVSNSELIDTRYQVFRRDRDRARSGRCDGGGVLVAVRRELSATTCPRAAVASDLHSPLVDHILIELRSRNYCCVLSAAYIPPKSSSEVYISHFNFLSQILESTDVSEFMIVGDYNLPTLEWRECGTYYLEPIMSSTYCLPNKHLLNLMSFLNGYQINRFRNSKNRILDLFVTNVIDCSTEMTPLPLVHPDKNHPPYYALIPISNPNLTFIPKKTSIQFNFNKADYEIINSDISSIDWDDLLSDNNVESAVTLFYEKIYDIIKKHIPTKSIKSSNFPIWFTPALIHIFKNKNNAWIKWKKYQNISDYETFALYRTRFKKESQKCYNNYIKSVEKGIHNNVKYFWKYIKNRKVTGDIPSRVTYGSLTADNPSDVCQLFSSFFKSVFEPSCVADSFDINNIPDNNHASDLIIDSVSIPKELVLKELRTLDISKGSGVDNLPPIFLRSTALTIYEPVHFIFNLCLREGTFPTIWKAARIVPVYKSGSRCNVENYRPISILSTLSKLFERLLHNIIYPSLHNIILPQQHGFTKRRSTITNLLVYTSYLFEGIDGNKQIDSVYTDFRKAFDRVDHKLLLEKIAFNGIRGDLWRWFKSYITNRTQKVVISGYESDFVTISSGVPQGSILGPLLFTLFINDIQNCFTFCNFLLYADDLKVFHIIDDAEDHMRFQSDLDRFSAYCVDNKLSLSIKKCKTITFTKKRQISNYTYNLNGINLESVESIKDLGVTLDSKLHLNLHVDNIINKAFKMYGFVMRSSAKFTQPSTFICLYNALIRPQLEYAVPIWNPYYSKYVEALEMVQKKFLRALHFRCSRGRLSYLQLLERYKLLTLTQRRKQLEAMLLYDLCHNRYDCSAIINKVCYRVPIRAHRRNPCPTFATPRCRTNAGKRSPLFRLLHSFNNLFNTIDIVATGPSAFKRKIVEALRSSD